MGRRARGEGSLYQRKDGLWVAQLNGTYRYAKSEQQAKQKLQKLIAGEDIHKPQSITVGVLLDDYLKHAATQGTLKRLTLQRYTEATTRHIIPAFGPVKLSTLDVATIERVYTDKLMSGLSPASIRLIHAVLSSAVKRAVRLGYIQSNVCRNVELPRDKQDAAEVEFFKPQEVQEILKTAHDDALEALWVLALTTGARVGELTALKGTNVNLDKGTLRISKTAHNGVIGPVKSKRSNRTIKLPRLARQVLEQHPDVNSNVFLFVHKRTGNPLSYPTLHKRWGELLAKAGVGYRNMHVCRHTVATTLLANGLPPNSIAHYLGHDTQTLLKTYGHLMPDQMDVVAVAMDNALG